MNVIFLDVDGVLNDKFSTKKNLMYMYYGFNVPNIDKNKVKILSFICNKYNCKVVLSSSWKLNRKYYDEIKDEVIYNDDYLYLVNLFKKYNIDFIGCTPNIKKNKYDEMWKELDIMKYLSIHNDINHFCIIDDENYDLNSLKDYLVMTSFDNGLCEKEIPLIEKTLLKENKYNKRR